MGLSVTSYANFTYVTHISYQSCEYKRHQSSSMLCQHRLGARPAGGAPAPLRRSFMAEGRLHRHEVFCTTFETYSPFQKHARYRRRRGKVGCCIASKRLGPYKLFPTSVAGGRVSRNHADIAGLLKPKRCNLPYLTAVTLLEIVQR